MPANKHLVKDVLEDKSLVDPEVLESPQVARRYAKGIVLCQQIGFSKGSLRKKRGFIVLSTLRYPSGRTWKIGITQRGKFWCPIYFTTEKH